MRKTVIKVFTMGLALIMTLGCQLMAFAKDYTYAWYEDERAVVGINVSTDTVKPGTQITISNIPKDQDHYFKSGYLSVSFCEIKGDKVIAQGATDNLEGTKLGNLKIRNASTTYTVQKKNFDYVEFALCVWDNGWEGGGLDCLEFYPDGRVYDPLRGVYLVPVEKRNTSGESTNDALAQYYAALEKQQKNTIATNIEKTTEELLAEYYAALAKHK